LQNQNHKNLIFTEREISQLSEACEILDPLAEATKLTEGEKSVTTSSVLPAVLKLQRHLNEYVKKAKHCAPLVKAMKQSMERRFEGLLNCATPIKFWNDMPPGNNVNSETYLIAPFFDPRFRLRWINKDSRSITVMNKDLLRSEVLGKLMLKVNI